MPGKDWSKIAQEIDAQEEEENKQLSGDASLQHFFQKIYSNASEEQRRAMMKSFQTSGGTVLSTNWEEVARKDFAGKDKPDCPKGQEWKRY